jgi:hypothetical protein
LKTGKHAIILLILLIAQPARSQTEMMDTLKASFHYTPKPYGTFGGRNSFVENSRADIWGFKLGISYNKRSRMSLGYSFMTSDLVQPILVPDAVGLNQKISMHMKLEYVSACFEYVYYKTRYWEFSIPLQIGIGNSRYIYHANGKDYIRDYQTIVLYEPMVQTEYYIFRWLGVEADVGLRLMLKQNTAIGKNFNSPMFAFGMFIAWDELYHALFHHRDRTKKT